MRRIYLDHHATTPLDPRVSEVMLRALTTAQAGGWPPPPEGAAVSALIGAASGGVCWTSGATEANRLALQGGGRVITTAVEHASLYRAGGSRVIRLPVDGQGRIDPDALRSALREPAAWVSIQHANNEVGVVQDLAALAAVAAEAGTPLHSDVTQSAGLLPIEADRIGLSAVSLSAHKLGGPQGIGALWSRTPRRREGALDEAWMVGLEAAAALALTERTARAERLRGLRDRLWERLLEAIPELDLNGPPLAARHPGNLHVHLRLVDAERLARDVGDRLAISTGAACASAGAGPSHVLLAMGLDEERARASIRLGVGVTTTEDEVDEAAAILARAVRAQRDRSPLWRATASPA